MTKWIEATAASHGAPLIMVTAQPQLGDIGILLVFGDFLRRHMAVIVDDGEIFGVGVIEDLRSLIL